MIEMLRMNSTIMCQFWNYWTWTLNPNSSPSIFDEFVEAPPTHTVDQVTSKACYIIK